METKTNYLGNTTEWTKGNVLIKWNCNKQAYFIYYKCTLIRTVYRFKDCKPYLNLAE